MAPRSGARPVRSSGGRHSRGAPFSMTTGQPLRDRLKASPPKLLFPDDPRSTASVKTRSGGAFLLWTARDCGPGHPRSIRAKPECPVACRLRLCRAHPRRSRPGALDARCDRASGQYDMAQNKRACCSAYLAEIAFLGQSAPESRSCGAGSCLPAPTAPCGMEQPRAREQVHRICASTFKEAGNKIQAPARRPRHLYYVLASDLARSSVDHACANPRQDQSYGRCPGGGAVASTNERAGSSKDTRTGPWPGPDEISHSASARPAAFPNARKRPSILVAASCRHPRSDKKRRPAYER